MLGTSIGRHQPGAHAAHPLAPEVAPGVHRHHIQPLLDQRDERQERVAPRLALEQIVRRDIGCRDHDHAAIEQRLEQPAKDHCVGNVVHLEFIEAQQRRFGRDPSASGGIGSSISGLALLNAWNRVWTFCMKRWKWMRCLRRTWAAAKNRSISMDLPRPTSPTMYSPFGCSRRRVAAQQAGEQAEAIKLARRRVVATQRGPKPLEALRHELLRGVRRQFAGRHHRPEGWQRPALRRGVGARVVHVRLADSASVPGVQRSGFRAKQRRMIELDYAALRATPVATDPFPHVVVPNFVPPAALRAVVADLPPLGRRGSFPLDALSLGPNARALMDELDGPRLRQAIAERLVSTSPTHRPW